MTEKQSVTEVGAAHDEIAKRMAELDACMSDEGIHLEARVHLTVPSSSRGLAEQRLSALRAIQVRQAAECEELTFLRGKILSDPGLARVWWMRQQPELISALGKEMLAAAVEEATTTTSPQEDEAGDDDLRVLRDFATWLREDKDMAVAVLRSFDTVLRLYGRSDLRSRLRALHPDLEADGIGGGKTLAEQLDEVPTDGAPPNRLVPRDPLS